MLIVGLLGLKQKLNKIRKLKKSVKLGANYAGYAQATCQKYQIRWIYQLYQQQPFGRQLT